MIITNYGMVNAGLQTVQPLHWVVRSVSNVRKVISSGEKDSVNLEGVNK